MGPDSSLTPELIQAQSFTTAFRGYDSAEVKSFLNRVSKEMRAWQERAEQLESAWHSAEERAARPPVLDEDTLMSAVGEETAAILRTARAAAAELRTKAAEEAERSVSEARTAADRMLSDAREESERTLSDARTEADRLLTEARAEAARLQSEAETALVSATAAAEEAAGKLMATARDEAAGILSKANAEADEVRAAADKERHLTIDGANTTRDRILEDLGRRRRVATVQIEQLRAGRERLIESYAVVRRTLEEVQSELSRADAEARAAADDVGRRLQKESEVQLSEPGPARQVDLLAGSGSAPPEAAAEAGSDAGTDDSGGNAAGTDETGTDHARRDDTGADDTGADDTGADDTGADEAGADGTGADTAGESSGETSGEVTVDPAGSAVDELFARIRANRRPDAAGPEDQGPGEAAAEADGGEVPAAGSAGDTGEMVAVAEEMAAEAPAAPAARRAKKRTGRTERATANGHARAGHPVQAAPSKGPRSNVTVIEPAGGAPVESSGEPAAETSSGGRAGRESASKEGARGGRTAVAADTEEGTDQERGEPLVADGDESLLQAREFAVVELETTLTRRLKRALQDEQNDVLDRLRNLKSAPTSGRLLPPAETQTARYADAARALLVEAATAGAVFADETLGLPGRDAPVEVDVGDLALECGSSIVDALRRRLEQAIEAGAGEDQSVLVDSLGAAYREWKTQRIERLAGDVLSAAFARGTWKAAPDGAYFRWVVDDADGPCPDCDDDALAGAIPRTEAFPTGQHHPPAHSGCRCLLVPDPAGG